MLTANCQHSLDLIIFTPPSPSYLLKGYKPPQRFDLYIVLGNIFNFLSPRVEGLGAKAWKPTGLISFMCMNREKGSEFMYVYQHFPETQIWLSWDIYLLYFTLLLYSTLLSVYLISRRMWISNLRRKHWKTKKCSNLYRYKIKSGFCRTN